ncbi:MAG: hypothetical protein IH991_17620 [Planctomycetes bacterium]|nr:hypothetical protein [Planctomycetota bacterium]
MTSPPADPHENVKALPDCDREASLFRDAARLHRELQQVHEWFEAEKSGTRVIEPEMRFVKPISHFAVLIGAGFRPSWGDVESLDRHGYLDAVKVADVAVDSTLPWDNAQLAKEVAYVKAKIVCEKIGYGNGFNFASYEYCGREFKSQQSVRNFYLMLCKLVSNQ